MGAPEEPGPVGELPHDLLGLAREPLPIERERLVAELEVRDGEIARVGLGVAQKLGFTRQVPVHAVESTLDGGTGIDDLGGPRVALPGRREQEVVALTPVRHRRASGDTVGPGEPGHEEDDCDRRGDTCREKPAARPGALEKSRDHDERNCEHEDRADERERRDRGRRGRPPRPARALPRAREHIGRGEDERARQRLAQHQWDVVLRPGVDRVEEAGEQRHVLAPPAANGRDQQERTGPEQDCVADQCSRVVAAVDRRLAEEREVERIPGRPERLALGGVPRDTIDPSARDVEPPPSEDEVEAGSQRRRVRRVEECIRGRDVRPRVRLFVRADERDVQRAVKRGRDREDDRAAPKGRSLQSHVGDSSPGPG